MKLLSTLLLALTLSATATAQTGITFSFANVTTDGATFTFDVMVQASDAGTKLGDTQVYLDYNPAGFGSDLQTQGMVTVTRGRFLTDALYGDPLVNDNDSSRLAITMPWPSSASPENAVALPTTPAPLFHVALSITDPTQSAGLGFNATLMTGQQFKSDNSTPYDRVTAEATEDAPLDPSLPVELVAFEATPDEFGVTLTWTTASELDNAGFEIQHRVANDPVGARYIVPLPEEGDAWQTLAFVDGHGTTTEARTYTYHLPEAEAGKRHYRLKQLNFDGSFTYSPEVEAVVEVPGTHRLSAAYPNPFNPQTTFALAVAEAQEVRIEVYNALGQWVLTLFEGPLPAHETQRFTWRAEALPSGLYLYRATGKTFAETRTVTLVK